MRFASLDVYPKTLQEFHEKTKLGAILSLVCGAVIALLICVEVSDFLQVKTIDHLYVDTSRGSRLRININMTFPALPCAVLSLDTLDISGNHAPEHAINVRKTRLDAAGRSLPDSPESKRSGPLGGPGGLGDPRLRMAMGQGPNGRRLLGLDPGQLAGRLAQPDAVLSRLLSDLLPTVFEDREAVAELRSHVGEGCHVEGDLSLARVAGNFHFACTKADHHTLMSVFRDRENMNVSHTIHSISFGDPDDAAKAAKAAARSARPLINPLDRLNKIVHNDSGFFQYHIKVVPTLWEPLWGPPLETNQFSYTELYRTTHELDKLPAVFFHYEISPIMARFTETRKGIGSFFTGLCAIAGGVFTLTSLLDSCLHAASKRRK